MHREVRSPAIRLRRRRLHTRAGLLKLVPEIRELLFELHDLFLERRDFGLQRGESGGVVRGARFGSEVRRKRFCRASVLDKKGYIARFYGYQLAGPEPRPRGRP